MSPAKIVPITGDSERPASQPIPNPVINKANAFDISPRGLFIFDPSPKVQSSVPFQVPATGSASLTPPLYNACKTLLWVV
jgi:hypothetical protein